MALRTAEAAGRGSKAGAASGDSYQGNGVSGRRGTPPLLCFGVRLLCGGSRSPPGGQGKDSRGTQVCRPSSGGRGTGVDCGGAGAGPGCLRPRPREARTDPPNSNSPPKRIFRSTGSGRGPQGAGAGSALPACLPAATWAKHGGPSVCPRCELGRRTRAGGRGGGPASASAPTRAPLCLEMRF